MSNKHPIPYLYWAPLASLWLALGILAALSGNLYVAVAAGAALGLLVLSLRLNVLHARRMTVLSTTVKLLDAKLDARISRAGQR